MKQSAVAIGTLAFVSSSGVYAQSLKPYPDAGASIEAVKSWANDLPAIGAAQYADKFGTKPRQGSPEYWGDHSVYQIFVDRFNNADGSNDKVNIQDNQRDQEASGDLWDIHSYRHGGDLRGIINRLDYIRDLGMGQLWISPIFTNSGGDYHGYCTSDFLEIDPGFGTLSDLQELVDEAHKRGIYVILDVVVNHMCDKNTRYQHDRSYNEHTTCASKLSENNWSGNGGSVYGQGWLEMSDGFFGPFRNNWFFNRCGPNSYEEMTGTGPAAIYGDFTNGMFDFDTSNGDWQYIFTQIHKYWIAAADIDGFRLDAVKHVTENFVTYFAPEIRAYSNWIGKHDFYMIGEIAADAFWQGRFLGNQYSDPNNPNNKGSGRTSLPQSATNKMWQMKDTYLAHPIRKNSGLTAVYDFAHSGTARESFRFEKDPRQLEYWLYGEGYSNLAAQGDSGLLWNNLEIHDWPRFLAGPHKHNKWLSVSANAYLIFARGIPITYYGSEKGMNGDCSWDRINNVGNAQNKIQEICSGHDHGLYRQTFWAGAGYNLGSAEANINDLGNIGPSSAVNGFDNSNWTQDPILAPTLISDNIRKMQRIRQSCVALKRGLQIFRWVNGDIVVFSRVYYDKEVIVALNPKNYGSTAMPNINIETGINVEGQQYKNLLNAAETGYTYWENGQLKMSFAGMQLEPHSYAVFVHSSVVSDYDTYLGTHLCNHLGARSGNSVENTSRDTLVISLVAGSGVLVAGLVATLIVYRRRKTAAATDPFASAMVVSDVETEAQQQDKVDVPEL